jgi:hypothetical protein
MRNETQILRRYENKILNRDTSITLRTDLSDSLFRICLLSISGTQIVEEMCIVEKYSGDAGGSEDPFRASREGSSAVIQEEGLCAVFRH